MDSLLRSAPLALAVLLAACNPPPGPPQTPAPAASSAAPAAPASAEPLPLPDRDDDSPEPFSNAEPSMASAGDTSRDEHLGDRAYERGLSPRRCDRASRNVVCLLLDVPAGATLRVELRSVSPAGHGGCHPIGMVRSSADEKKPGHRPRTRLRLRGPASRGLPAGLCRAMTWVHGSADLGPFERGTIELVAENALITGVSLAPAASD